eukprot:g6106.t1
MDHTRMQLQLFVVVLGTAQVGAKTVNISAAVTLPADPVPANRLVMGCHSDSGYMAQPFGLESQMVWGESFEGNWSRGRYVPLRDPSIHPNISWNHLHDGDAVFATDAAAPFHGLASQRIELRSGSFAFVSNRGLGNQGLVLRAGKEYTGYVFARSADAVQLTVALHNIGTAAARGRELLASTVIAVAGDSQWKRYNFSLTPTGSTSCAIIPFGSDPSILCSDGSSEAAATARAAGCLAHVKTICSGSLTSVAACDACVTSECAGQAPCANISECDTLTMAEDKCKLIVNQPTPAPGPGPHPHPPPAPRPGWRPEPGDACQRCGGELAIGLTRAGDSVNLDFAALHPGEWGRFAGLEVRREAVELLRSMGVAAIRQGGSFSDPAYYYWKNWRGRKWERASFGAFWERSYESSWGPFDFIDMCNAMGIVPIMTTAAEATLSGDSQASHNIGPDFPTICCSAEDMGDLVEYAWGDATTTWGRQRIADGHPAPYNVTWFELGNEQKNSRFVDQVRAMEARAEKVGVAGKLRYLWPDTHYIGEDLNRTELLRAAALGLNDRLLMDVHTGPTGGVPLAQAFFANATQSFGGPGVMNLETNAATHGMQRALTEALDLNAFLTYSPPSTSPPTSASPGNHPLGGSSPPTEVLDADGLPRMKGRMGSFCMQASGHADSHFGQGLAFYSADQMWLQPGGWVHKMYNDAWLPLTAGVALDGTGRLPAADCGLAGSHCQPKWMDGTPAARPGFCCNASASAAFSSDRSQLSLRFVNPSNSTTVLLSILVRAAAAGPKVASPWRLLNVTQLAHSDLRDANPPNDTMRISPSTLAIGQRGHSAGHGHGGGGGDRGGGDGSISFLAPPQSISVAVLARSL